MCKRMLVSLAVLLVGTCGALAGGSVQDFLTAERKFADENTRRPQEVSVTGNIVALIDPVTEGTIKNARVRSEVPRILSVNPDFAHLKVRVVASLGTVVVEGEVNITSLSTPSSFLGYVSITYGNVTASGTADIVAAQNVLQATRIHLAYLPKNRSANVAFDVPGDGDLGELAEAFFEKTVERMAVVEMNRRVSRQLNKVLKEVSIPEGFGRDAAKQRVQDSFNPVAYGKSHENINFLVDTLIAKMLPKIPALLSLSDINKPFKKKFLLVPIFGQFIATNGTLKDPKTLRRTSDMFLNLTSTGFRLVGAMGLGNLQLSYNYYISVLGTGLRGRLEATVGRNSLGFALTVTYDGQGNCTVRFEDLRVEALEDYNIKITGFGIFNKPVSSLVLSVVNDCKDIIIEYIETSLKRNLEVAAREAGICDIF